ncbi:MAG: gluconolactonase [Verrucomicrobia bacterium]|nr:gluconolactonase [Verrucomicrobiota bacterium]
MTPEELALEFPLGPDSLPQPGVPMGSVEKYSSRESRAFPGTVRDYWVYVPQQYDPAVPACVFVVQDGEDHLRADRRWRIPTILDNLIHQKAIPVMIGIFINPGVVPAAAPGVAARPNRSFEYDSLGDAYARFVTEEILPEMGRRYNLTPDSNGRAIMGGSSGAFCAFNVAWERPDVFQRVLSIVGSYTAMRGGHTMAARVRLTEPKPLRIFLESGNDDLEVFAGHWWVGNLDMLGALSYAGYEVEHAWAKHAGHNDYHGSMIFPEALRWLWRDHPKKISAGAASRQAVARVLVAGEGWGVVEGAYPSAGPLAAGAKGEIFFASATDGCVYRVDDERRVEVFARNTEGVSALATASDGRLIVCQPTHRSVSSIDGKGAVSRWIGEVAGWGAAVAKNGSAYITDKARGSVWLATQEGEHRVVTDSVAAPSAVALSMDQSQLIVGEANGPIAHLFTILPDGSLTNGSAFFRLNRWNDFPGGGASSVVVTPRGWSVFATPEGIQLAEPNGLVAGIISLPSRAAAVGICLGGRAQDELYVSDGARLYRRKIRLADGLWG